MNTHRSRHRTAAVATVAVLAISGVVAMHTEPPSALPSPCPIAAQALSAVQPEQPPAPPELRSEATPEPATAMPARDFIAEVRALALTSIEITRLAQAEEFAAARAADEAARQQFTAIATDFDRLGERVLDFATSLVASQDHAAPAMLQVLAMLLDLELDRSARSPACDDLVAALLATLAFQGDVNTALLPVALRGTRVHLPHEAAVLQLVTAAGQAGYPRDDATKLLLALWRNIGELGERSSDELANLAWLAMDQDDASQRLAAFRHLIADARYRPMVLAWLREKGDREMARSLAQIAASDLPADAALATLRELKPMLGSSPGVFMALGFRAAEQVGAAYEQLLADGVQADLRRDLLAGVGMDRHQTSSSVELLRLALDHDPDVQVRLQAMLSLSCCAPQQQGEAACQRVIEDPSFTGAEGRYATVMMAMQNLEVAGLTNAIDRLGRRLQAAPLEAETKEQLAQLLQRALPH